MYEPSPRILHVSDRDLPRSAEILRRAGCEMTCVATGAEALVAARAAPELVLIDVHLPDLDGREVCRRLKQDPATADLPVLLTSAAFVTASDRVAGLDAGAEGYLCQPFETAELLAAVRALVRMRRAEARARALAAELAEAQRHRDEFLEIASHELKTPLTGLQLQLDSLHRALRAGRADPADLEPRVDGALRQTARLGALIDDLLDVSRITAGRLRIEADDVDLGELVAEVVARFAAPARRAGCELRVTAEGPVSARVDRRRIDQVITSLLSNAIKYGGHQPIDLALRSDGARRILTVRDRGIGIDREDRERIFGRFERAASRRHYGGLGLGLFVARQIVEAHGGAITVEGEPGAGAMFTVDLPAIPAAAACPEQRGA